LSMGNMTNKLTVGDVNINGTLTLSSANGGNIWVNGSWNRSSTGTFNPNFTSSTGVGRSVYFVGSNNATITANGGEVFPYLFMDKAAQSNSVSLLDSVTVIRTLNLVRGTLALGDKNLALLSNADYTAAVSEIVTPANIDITYGTGRFVHQRFIPSVSSPRRAWRLLTSPLSNSISIFDSWQNGGVYQAGKGTHITSPGATGPDGNGLDINATSGTSFRLWNPATQGYFNVTNTKTENISRGTGNSAANTGYFIFVRGDRETGMLDFGSTLTNSTTLSSRGKLQYGEQSFTDIATGFDKFTLIGNPFASPIDLNLVLNNSGNVNIQRKIYTWDSRANLVGGYVALSEDVPGDGAFIADPSYGRINQNIQSGQSFFVITDNAGTAPELKVLENDKVATTSASFMRPANVNSTVPNIRTNLYLLNTTDNTVTDADGASARFNATFCGCVNTQDNIKLTNVNETFGLMRNGSFLATERRPEPVAGDTLFMRLTRSTQRSYQLQVVPENMNPSLYAVLEDAYLNTSTVLNMTDTNRLNFVINADVLSQNQDRFRIVFGAAPIPVTFTNIKASARGNDIAVEWKVDNQINIASYQVEKSTDGRNFTKVNTTAAIGVNGSTATYNWLDVNAVTGANYYRIKSVGVTGLVEMSRIVKVTMGKGQPGISVYPNPVTDGVIGVQLNNLTQGIYSVRITNTLGQQLFIKQINHDGGSATETIVPEKRLPIGIYQLELLAPDKTRSVTQLIVE
ncbi:MAG: T9SS type A sorting domain-containing protein, partial [Ferruginibacter sp.]